MDPDAEEVNKKKHKWNRAKVEDKEIPPPAKIVKPKPAPKEALPPPPPPPPKPVVTTKEDLEREAELESMMMLCLIGVFGGFLMIAIICIFIYCYKEWLKAKENKDREAYNLALRQHEK